MLKRLPDDPTNWLLIKERDPAARPISEFDVVRDRPESVITGRRVEEVAAPVAAPPRGLKPPKAAKIRGAKPAPIPDRVPPMLATSQSATPEGSGWVHEIKYDGYRTLAFIEAGEVRMITRNGLDWTNRYGALARAFKQLACTDAVIDGEVAVQDPRGVTSIHLLEQALSEGRTHAMTFFAFDLLHLDGYDLRAATLLDRKKALAALLDPVLDARSPIQLSEHVEGDGDTLFQRACEMGLEGVVSKRADARYVSGRSDNWVKVKRVEFDDFVVIGFTVNAVRSVAAVIVADDTPDGLVYAGKAGSGIGDARARELYAMFAAAIVERAAAKAPRMKEAIWVEPRWLARIGHRGRTTTNAPRQPVLLDIRPRIVRPPRPASAPLKRRLVSDGDLAAIRITNPDREMIEGGERPNSTSRFIMRGSATGCCRKSWTARSRWFAAQPAKPPTLSISVTRSPVCPRGSPAWSSRTKRRAPRSSRSRSRAATSRLRNSAWSRCMPGAAASTMPSTPIGW